MGQIRPSNEKAAAAWGAGGRDYDRISETVADALEHVVVRIAPSRGERFLDVGTGTGWTARRLAARGAQVVGVDIGQGVIDAAKTLAPDIDFRVGDAEALAFEDSAFDGVTSTFGVMFAARPEAAAAELARVCRKGGRLGLATWTPGSTIEGWFKAVQPYLPPPPPPPPPSPFEWGKPERLRALLGDAFDLKFEPATTVLRLPTGKAAWDLFVSGFGPTKMLAAACDPERRQRLERDFIAFHETHRGELGIAMPRDYLVTIGVRK